MADAVDAFAERIAFTPDETARIFAAARARGLPVKLHADQLSDQGGSALAARFGALSADHLEYANQAGIEAMAASGTVAVLLPAAFYFLRETQLPPLDLLRRQGVPIAIASDCNPGSSPALSPLLVLNMACTLFRMTPEEAIAGMTRNAARALGLEDRGMLAPGLVADFAVWEVSRPAELAYWMGGGSVAPCRHLGRRAGEAGLTCETFHLSRGTTPLLISCPHVGTFIPEALSRRMTAAALALPDTDWHVDRLYDFAGGLGAGMQVATQSRYVVDLNRDPAGQPLYPGGENSELVPLATFANEAIYRPGEAPDASEVAERVARHWQPYHRSLAQELDRLKQHFGFAVLWDAHAIASRVPRFFAGRLPDLNLGSARGASAAPRLVRLVMAVLDDAGPFSAVLDGRFTGGYITRHFGRPDQRVHALQLEMAEIAYMEETPPYEYDQDRAAPVKRVLERAIRAILGWAAEP